MISEETIEGNILIGEFMGERLENSTQISFWINVPDKTLKRWINITELKYHTSWDWLMPVVEKIRDTPMIIGKVMPQTNKWEKICTWLMVADKNRIWLSVVEFIKWYNQNQNK